LEGDLETDFPKLQDCNKAEGLEREEQDTLILKKIVEESATIAEKINNEKRAREGSEEQILELLKGMIDTIRQDMELEKQTREESEETLLTLLEDTCTKLNNANIMWTTPISHNYLLPLQALQNHIKSFFSVKFLII